MTNAYSRKEITHIDEMNRRAVCSMQWLVEPRNMKGAATHPITHNNKLKLLICGQKGFDDIAKEIARAEHTIDICCWGFDPGMELQRSGSPTWPRGATFGDLLINAAKRGVQIRLLIWTDWIGGELVNNMPGYTDGGSGWYAENREAELKKISAERCINDLRKFNKEGNFFEWRVPFGLSVQFPLPDDQIPGKAREHYCYCWFSLVMEGWMPGITLRTRSGSPDAIKRSLASEQVQPAGFSQFEVEKAGYVHMGTHHQKTILIDYAHKAGCKAVGYVMGLNSVTDYWDTAEHKLEDPLREAGGKAEQSESVQVTSIDAGFKTLKPYQDYACRIDAGLALVDVHRNFLGGWIRVGGGKGENLATMNLELLAAPPPSALRREAEPGDSTVQVVRTQPEENDKSIQDAFWQATATAATTAGYIYIENQYFQCEHWAQHLMECRRQTISKWRASSNAAGKTREDMPMLYLFVVTPVPERAQMIPRTHDTLATLGAHGGMKGQNQLIKEQNEMKPHMVVPRLGRPVLVPHALPTVVKHANSIVHPDAARLEAEYGLKVCVAMLNTCAFENGHWRYREIYVHSKLMIANDTFLMVGSANANQRSFAVDSEIDVAVLDPVQATNLRREVWAMMSGSLVDGGDGGPAALMNTFRQWTVLMDKNLSKRNSAKQNASDRKLRGFILRLEDMRSSFLRLG